MFRWDLVRGTERKKKSEERPGFRKVGPGSWVDRKAPASKKRGGRYKGFVVRDGTPGPFVPLGRLKPRPPEEKPEAISRRRLLGWFLSRGWRGLRRCRRWRC
jgi:hypothetical protein